MGWKEGEGNREGNGLLRQSVVSPKIMEKYSGGGVGIREVS